MNRKLSYSSMIQSVGYDSISHVLEVEFRSNGSIYRYHEVPDDVAEGLASAASQGRYFLSEIRERYTTERVD